MRFRRTWGLTKSISYRFDAAKGTLTPNQPPFVTVPAGSGPRHFAFDSHARFGYVIEEMGSSITQFSYDAAHGVLHPMQTISTLPGNFKGSSTCAEVAICPSGKFLYGSNRGADSITVFAIDPVKGTLKPVEYVPPKAGRRATRNRSGGPLSDCRQSGFENLVVFRIDAASGRLTPTGQKSRCTGAHLRRIRTDRMIGSSGDR